MSRAQGDRTGFAGPGSLFTGAVRAMALLVALLYLLPVAWIFSTSLAAPGTPPAEAGSLLPRYDAARAAAASAARAMQRAGQSPWQSSAAAAPENGDDHAAPALLTPVQSLWWQALTDSAAVNYTAVWTNPTARFPLYFRNTLFVTIFSVLGMTFSSAVVAYGFSRLRWRGREKVFVIVLATMMVPFPVIMAPLYLVFRSLGWIGSYLPLIVPTFFGGAFSIFLLRQFFLTIPRQLDEAAAIDGCSHVGTFFRIILPLSRPALTVCALYQAIASWNDFVGPLIFLNHSEKFTLGLGLYMYQSQHGGTPWPLVMSATTLVVMPVLLLFVLAQRSLVEGIAAQGIKG